MPEYQSGSDNTNKPMTKAETAKAKAERDAAKAKWDSMTTDEKREARRAADVLAQRQEEAMEKMYQNPQGRNAGITKSAADSMAGPTPRRDLLNTPQGEKFLSQQKGQ
jgi:hypothetical protein